MEFSLIPMPRIVDVILANLLAPACRHFLSSLLGLETGKVFTALTLATMVTCVPPKFSSTAEWVRLATGAVIFLAVYIISTPLTGAITVLRRG